MESVAPGFASFLLAVPGIDVGAVGDEFADEIESVQFARSPRRRVTVATKWFTDPTDRVQCRETASVVIRIGARAEQSGGELKVSIFNRQN